MRPVTTSSAVAQYDVALLQAVAQRWYRLLDAVPGAAANGKVVVEFNIPPDGKVPEARISESAVDKSLALICQKAVLDASPFAPWPQEMREALPNDLRTATFTFSFHRQDNQ
jgi:TonB family protein